jgi:multidrug efflux pump subunit AcrB
VTITADARDGALSQAAARIERLMASTKLPKGTTWALAGQAVERRDAGARLVLVAGIVLCAVFAFLWMAFGSAADAIAVLAGLPLGLVGGAVAALLLTDGLSMAGLVGFVALCGIMSRNGIMLVAHKNHLVAAHPEQSVEAHILTAARERFLPIIMTAATAFFGLLPLAASVGEAGSELESPMAFIVCGGILSSTVLNLIAVPATLLWFERLRKRRSRP